MDQKIAYLAHHCLSHCFNLYSELRSLQNFLSMEAEIILPGIDMYSSSSSCLFKKAVTKYICSNSKSKWVAIPSAARTVVVNRTEAYASWYSITYNCRNPKATNRTLSLLYLILQKYLQGCIFIPCLESSRFQFQLLGEQSRSRSIAAFQNA